ncbi:MAG: M20 family metallopeptidase [Chloroflexi bacterium]|nr:M20 family metallopeptidase [Chloroflexota bacterium]
MITTIEQHVLSFIDDDELIRWVQELTRIKSVWQPELNHGEADAAQWVAERCRVIGLDVHVEYPHPARPNVIALYGAGTGPTLMFEGHTDVVTEGDPTQWTDPPFSAAIRDGRIYGRGANDMKAGLVCALVAMQAIMRSGVRLNGNILIGAVCDEEGPMIGIKHFVDRGWADRVSAAIICEPEENHLCITQKGVMWIEATIHGVMSHGAMPLTGVNSAYPMARFLTLVHSLEEREIAVHGRDPLLGQPSITPTILRSPPAGAGEPQKNVMPAATDVVLDFRLIPGQEPDALARQVEAMLAAVVAVDPRLRTTMRVVEVRQPTKTDRNHPVVTTLASAFRDLTGREPVYGGVPGSTDGTILNARKGIPIVTCGPGDIYIPHHIDEWVSIDEIKTAARMYVLAALRYLGVN